MSKTTRLDFGLPQLLRPVFHLADGAMRVTPEQAGTPSESGDDQRLLIAGDWASVRCYEDAAARSPQDLYGNLASLIAEADLSIVNLECAIAGDEPVFKDGPNLKGTPESPAALKQAGFDIATLGNNHTMDYGPEGLAQTIALCQQAGLQPVGAGMNLDQAMQPVFAELAGKRVGILSVCDREEGDAEWNRCGVAPAFDQFLLDRVRAMRAECDWSLVIMHGGKEYVPVPPPYWYERVLAVAGTGVDAVVCHHPHVIQGMTYADRAVGLPVPVIFSTGNFIFRPALENPPLVPPRTSDGYMVELGLRDTGVAHVTLHPYAIEGGDGVRALAQTELDDYKVMLEAISEPLLDRQAIHDWFDAIVDLHWTANWHPRLEGLTPKLCAGDVIGLRHGRSHHRSFTHATLIDRAIERQLTGTFGSAKPELREKLDAWFAGTWPCPSFGKRLA